MRIQVARHDQIRIVSRFAILPVSIHGEIRWMERVYIVQQFSCKYGGAGYWHDRAFATPEDFEEFTERPERYCIDRKGFVDVAAADALILDRTPEHAR